ncbi:helix-turn-helix domain-containing protein [Demequina sp. SYSU T00192]|uniref:Helix-turn-helix domain-containing protein n=1 Tax=Demequina litoralis TaxID=3051660 RepID=A0ABT8G5M6_9MICO|nr:helix-turn-helix domain-containing protein [Demequina sp. SYSU T00192]MDN4474337.1 helix-turn-helix domain-containing protein [Demequina sp. SYSU T00192]
MPTNSPLLYTPADAARLLSIGRSTLYELMDEGVVPFVKIGRSRRIRTEALEAYVDSL